MKTIRLSVIFLMIICISGFSGCSSQPLKIGLMVDLTGRASGLGITARNGAFLAVEEINQSGGIKGRTIELVVKDDKGLPDEAIKIDNELVNEKVLLGIGHMTSGTGMAGLDVFKKANLLMISPLISTESLSGIDDLFLRVIGSNKKQGEILAQAALKKDLKKGMAILYEYNNRAYSKVVCDFFKSEYTKGGGKIVYESGFVSTPNTDLQKVASEVSASGASGVLIVSGGTDLGVLVQLLKKNNSEMEIYSGMWGMTEDAVQKGGKAIEGAFFAGAYDKSNQNPDFIKFRQKYIDKYKEEPTFASVYAFEAIKMVSQALENTTSTSTESIKKAIIGISSYKGLQQDFSIDRYGDSNRGYFLLQVKNAEFARVKTDE